MAKPVYKCSHIYKNINIDSLIHTGCPVIIASRGQIEQVESNKKVLCHFANLNIIYDIN